MAPVASRLSAEGLGTVPRRALTQCLCLLRLYPVLTKAATRFFCTGPLSHCFYLLVECWIPAEAPLAGVRRLLLERALFMLPCLLLFFLSMDLLEGRSMATFSAKMREGFWPVLRTNWKIWTPVQFIDLNYIPLQFWVLFANLVSLFWFPYLASLRK